MKQMMKRSGSIRRSFKLILVNRTRRVFSIAALFALILTLTVLVWSKPQQSEQVNLTLRSEGFDPLNVHHASGSFTLSIANQSNSSAVTLRLYRSNGEKVREIGITGAATEWSDTVELSAGNYTLLAPDNPAWTCHFDIQ
jgi:hypothetical protein